MFVRKCTCNQNTNSPCQEGTLNCSSDRLCVIVGCGESVLWMDFTCRQVCDRIRYQSHFTFIIWCIQLSANASIKIAFQSYKNNNFIKRAPFDQSQWASCKTWHLVVATIKAHVSHGIFTWKLFSTATFINILSFVWLDLRHTDVSWIMRKPWRKMISVLISMFNW